MIKISENMSAGEIRKLATFFKKADQAILTAILYAEDCSNFIGQIRNLDDDGEINKKIAKRLMKYREESGAFADPKFCEYYFHEYEEYMTNIEEIIEGKA